MFSWICACGQPEGRVVIVIQFTALYQRYSGSNVHTLTYARRPSVTFDRL